MTRSTCVVALLAASGMMVVNNIPQRKGANLYDENHALDPEIVAARTRMLDQAHRSHGRFMLSLTGVLMSLAREDISLREACALVYNRSREVYPLFLEHLHCATAGDQKRKISGIIFLHLEELAEERSEIVGVVSKVRQESRSKSFQAWCRKGWENHGRVTSLP
jgi:hypothetical protein